MTTHTTYDEAKHPRSQDGKFSTKPAGESGTDLATDPLTPEQRALVDAIYAAEYADRDESAERIENMDELQGLDGYDDAAWVAEQLQQGHAPDLAFDYDYSTGSMEITGYNVGVRLDDGTQWTAYRDTDELTTNRNATGEAAAAGYAESILADYQYMRGRAVKAGLIQTDKASVTATADMNETWEPVEVEELSVGDRFSYEGELYQVASTDGDHKSISVETDEGEILTFRRDQKVMVESVHRCQSCGRPEETCSADPCVDVIREQGEAT